MSRFSHTPYRSNLQSLAIQPETPNTGKPGHRYHGNKSKVSPNTGLPGPRYGPKTRSKSVIVNRLDDRTESISITPLDKKSNTFTNHKPRSASVQHSVRNSFNLAVSRHDVRLINRKLEDSIESNGILSTLSNKRSSEFLTTQFQLVKRINEHKFDELVIEFKQTLLYHIRSSNTRGLPKFNLKNQLYKTYEDRPSNETTNLNLVDITSVSVSDDIPSSIYFPTKCPDSKHIQHVRSRLYYLSQSWKHVAHSTLIHFEEIYKILTKQRVSTLCIVEEMSEFDRATTMLKQQQHSLTHYLSYLQNYASYEGLPFDNVLGNNNDSSIPLTLLIEKPRNYTIQPSNMNNTSNSFNGENKDIFSRNKTSVESPLAFNNMSLRQTDLKNMNGEVSDDELYSRFPLYAKTLLASLLGDKFRTQSLVKSSIPIIDAANVGNQEYDGTEKVYNESGEEQIAKAMLLKNVSIRAMIAITPNENRNALTKIESPTSRSTPHSTRNRDKSPLTKLQDIALTEDSYSGHLNLLQHLSNTPRDLDSNITHANGHEQQKFASVNDLDSRFSGGAVRGLRLPPIPARSPPKRPAPNAPTD